MVLLLPFEPYQLMAVVVAVHKPQVAPAEMAVSAVVVVAAN